MLERHTPLKRTPFKPSGTPLKPVGKRGKRLAKGDRLISAAVKTEEVCGWCGLPFNGEQPDPHHIVKRRHKTTRHLPENVLPVHRSPCHDYIEAHPAEFKAFMLAHHRERYERLQRIKTGQEAA